MAATVTISKAKLQRWRLKSPFMKQRAQRGLFLETAREFAERAVEFPEFALEARAIWMPTTGLRARSWMRFRRQASTSTCFSRRRRR
jgi:hypothetical protein